MMSPLITKTLKIGITGSHCTGKTSLLKAIAKKYSLEIIDKTISSHWHQCGIYDFEKLSKQERSFHQKLLLGRQLSREFSSNTENTGFVTDRTVIDIWGYTVVSSDIDGRENNYFKSLVKQNLTNYTHIIYTPIEDCIPYEPRLLRADLKNRVPVDKAIYNFLNKNNVRYYKVFGTIENRLEQIYKYIEN